MKIALAGLAFIVVLVIGGAAVLINVNVAPPAQKVEQVIPDEHFPR